MAPGNLVVSAYVTCPDITKVVTPDLKAPGSSSLVHVDLVAGRRRLGGSALAQVFGQLGGVSPDVDIGVLGAAFNTTQALIERGLLLAGHDVSDGGLATTLLEMAFAGNCGLEVDIPAPAVDAHGALAALFAEELGLVVEVASGQEAEVIAAYWQAGVSAEVVGRTRRDMEVSITVADQKEIQGMKCGEWQRCLECYINQHGKRNEPITSIPPHNLLPCHLFIQVPPLPCAIFGRQPPFNWSASSAQRRMWKRSSACSQCAQPLSGSCPSSQHSRATTHLLPRVSRLPAQALTSTQ